MFLLDSSGLEYLCPPTSPSITLEEAFKASIDYCLQPRERFVPGCVCACVGGGSGDQRKVRGKKKELRKGGSEVSSFIQFPSAKPSTLT